MSKEYGMTWVQSSARWCKHYKGKHYYFSAKGQSKEESYAACWQQWLERKRQIDAEAATPRPETVSWTKVIEALAVLTGQRPGATFVPTPGAGPTMGPAEPALTADAATELLLWSLQTQAANKQGLFAGLLAPSQLRAPAPEPVAPWAPTGDSVGHQAAIFSRRRENQAANGGISAGRVENLRRYLAHFTAFVGADTPVSAINEKTVSGYFEHLNESLKGRTAIYLRDHWRAMTQFLRWLDKENLLLRLPKNLDSSEFRFTVPPKVPKTFTVPEVQRLVDAASPWLRCMLLLCLNVGGTPVDLASLRTSEIDWSAGRISRKRHKTAKHESTPTISYKLWGCTLAALKQFAVDGEYALRSPTGKPLRSGRTDHVGRAFRKLAHSLGIRGCVKMLRSTGATLLDRQFVREISRLYPGRGVRGVDEQSYIAVPADRLDAALEWLGGQYGLVPASEAFEGENRPR